jgi:fatty-acid desaturase
MILSSSTRGAQILLTSSLIASIVGAFYFSWRFTEFLLILFGYFIYGCLGIVVGFHRGLTHSSYKTYRLVTKLLSLLGCFAGTGSPLAWVAIHINHHLKSDKPGDPHSPIYQGLKIFALDYTENVAAITKWKMRDLVTDRYQQFLHRYYFGIVITWTVLLIAIGGIHFALFFHVIPMAITGLMSNIVNYVGHMPSWLGGYRRYNLNDQSANNWLWAIPSWGESWHNNHHRFPRNSSFSQTWYEFDIAGLVIKFIKI